jgi:serine/threonine protein phosphatase 1
MLNIIADVAGEYNALMELVRIMPKAPIVLLGDLNDRGPQSREVIEWAMRTPDVQTINSNHGEMFVDYVLRYVDSDYVQQYHHDDFLNNGGVATLESYGFVGGQTHLSQMNKIPLEHIYWLRDLPNVIETEDLIMSHAPLHECYKTIEQANADRTLNFHSPTWNRTEPPKRNKFQVFGHNSHWGLSWLTTWKHDPRWSLAAEQSDEKEVYAVCLDASREKVLTGMHWPTREIFQVPYRKRQKTEIDLGF